MPPLPAAAPVPPATDAGVAETPPKKEETEPAAYVPAAPRKVSITLEGSTVVVKWNPVSSKPIAVAGYIVYRGTPGASTGKALNDTPTKKTVFRDRKAEGGKSYDYWVVTQTVEGGTSAPSKKINVDVPKSGSVVPFF